MATDPDARVFYVYVFFYPNGRPCYVGKGTGGRWRDHVRKAKNKQLRGVFRKADGELPVVIIREELIESEAFSLERALIAAIGRADLGDGSLVNHTDGGDGMANPSVAIRHKMRLAKLNKRQSAEVIERRTAPLRGRKRPNELVESLRKQRIEKFADPINGAAHKAALCGIWITDGTQNRRVKSIGKIPEGWRRGRSSDLGEKISVTLKRLGFLPPRTTGRFWITDGEKARLLLIGSEVPSGWRKGKSPAAIAKVSAKLKSRNAHPVWVTDGVSTKTVADESLIPEGWRRGRAFTKKVINAP
jgi:hypothetical protein